MGGGQSRRKAEKKESQGLSRNDTGLYHIDFKVQRLMLRHRAVCTSAPRFLFFPHLPLLFYVIIIGMRGELYDHNPLHPSVTPDYMRATEEFNLSRLYPQSFWIIALGSYVECKRALLTRLHCIYQQA